MTQTDLNAEELRSARQAFLLFLIVVSATVDGYLALFSNPLWWLLGFSLLIPSTLSLIGVARRAMTAVALVLSAPILFLTVTSVLSIWPYFLLDPIVAAIYGSANADVELVPDYVTGGATKQDIEARLAQAGFDFLNSERPKGEASNEALHYEMFGRYHAIPLCRDMLFVRVATRQDRVTGATGYLRTSCL